jgi:hypothetical protein
MHDAAVLVINRIPHKRQVTSHSIYLLIQEAGLQYGGGVPNTNDMCSVTIWQEVPQTNKQTNNVTANR